MKKCVKCGESTSLNRSYCKNCHCEYQKQYAQNLKTKYGIGIRTIKTFGLEKALYVYDRAGRKCEICGEVNDLTIHHKDHKGRNFMNKGLLMNNNVENLMVLCRSCHGKIHAYEGLEKRYGKKYIVKNLRPRK